ncbi:MAG: LysR family transcriptional regulator [Halobacteriovoraceae bacterium]|nr:LysR family transcriptional regulator [Halobacteriovoraceae bacterium]
MSTITQLEYLLAVDRFRHFGRAAKECHVTQPSLSMQLQKLEDELGVILFDRSKKPILPTEIGKKVIQQAKIVLQEHRKIEHIASQIEDEVIGQFKLGVIPTISPYLVPYFYSQFVKKYPHVNLTLIEMRTEDIIQELKDDRIDAGILATPLYDDQIIERVLFYEPFSLYVGTDHEYSSSKEMTLSKLKSDDIWLLDEGHCLRSQVERICSSAKKNKFKFKVGSLETIMNLIKESGGYTLIPELVVERLNKKEKEKYVREILRPRPSREVSIVHSRVFLKENIINSLEKVILDNLPAKLKSYKRSDLKVVDI